VIAEEEQILRIANFWSFCKEMERQIEGIKVISAVSNERLSLA